MAAATATAVKQQQLGWGAGICMLKTAASFELHDICTGLNTAQDRMNMAHGCAAAGARAWWWCGTAW